MKLTKSMTKAELFIVNKVFSVLYSNQSGNKPINNLCLLENKKFCFMAAILVPNVTSLS